VASVNNSAIKCPCNICPSVFRFSELSFPSFFSDQNLCKYNRYFACYISFLTVIEYDFLHNILASYFVKSKVKQRWAVRGFSLKCDSCVPIGFSRRYHFQGAKWGLSGLFAAWNLKDSGEEVMAHTLLYMKINVTCI